MTPIALPEAVRLPDICRHLPAGHAVAYVRSRDLRDGHLVLAEVLPGATPSIDLLSGRAATLFPGDRLIVAIGSVRNPLGVSAECPAALGEVALVHRSGIAGLVTALAPRTAEPARLKLLGVCVDAAGESINLNQLSLPLRADARPLHSLAVVSASRGARAAQVASALVRGYHRTGLRCATAKPLGMPDAAERWSLMDAGAVEALDLIDAGRLCAAGLDASQLLQVTRGLLGRFAQRGIDASVLRIAGGIATPEVSRLLAEGPFSTLVDGVVLAAADALSAVEGARRLRAHGLRLLALSGAITRSPLACREAAQELNVPIVSFDELSRPVTLQRLLARTASARYSIDADLQVAA